MSSFLDPLLKRRVLFVTGKGGVGKSTIAAALALAASDRGLRTLLIDVEAKGDAARFLDAGPPRYKAKEARPGLHHLAFEPEEALHEYLRRGLRLPSVYRLGPVSKVFDFIATAAPGIKEVLIAGKVGFEERAQDGGRPRWDLIVADAAPAGQVLSHLRGPRTIQELVQVGLIRNQTAWVQEILEDPARTGMVVVALPEEMPVAETAELLDLAPKTVSTPVLAIVANRVVPPPTHPATFEKLLAAKDELGAPLGLALDAMDLYADLAEAQAPYRQRLRELGPPTVEVPLLPLGHHTLETSKRVAEALIAGAVEAAA